MEAESRWLVTEERKQKLITTLSDNLQLMRVKLGVSQEELSRIIGISRQTYSSYETGKRMMSWQVYMSLVLFFDINPSTHELLHHLGCFPDILIDKTGTSTLEASSDHSDILEMLSKVDEQALRSIRTVLMVEYARCTHTPGDFVLKAFDGSRFKKPIEIDQDIRNAIENIKQK